MNSGPGGSSLNPWLIAFAALTSLIFFGFIVRKAVAARSRVALRGSENLVGSIGEAREDLNPEGRIFVAGAVWDGISTGAEIPRGTAVTVVAQKGARLAVAPTASVRAQAAEASGEATSRRRLRQRAS